MDIEQFIVKPYEYFMIFGRMKKAKRRVNAIHNKTLTNRIKFTK